ncbi:MAG: hypothetical protein JNL36_07680 [Candidatus Kapabacteria bacterium]|nr:hypothetical protein [Candidatus Kapabacteria bacterium]
MITWEIILAITGSTVFSIIGFMVGTVVRSHYSKFIGFDKEISMFKDEVRSANEEVREVLTNQNNLLTEIKTMFSTVSASILALQVRLDRHDSKFEDHEKRIIQMESRRNFSS